MLPACLPACASLAAAHQNTTNEIASEFLKPDRGLRILILISSIENDVSAGQHFQTTCDNLKETLDTDCVKITGADFYRFVIFELNFAFKTLLTPTVLLLYRVSFLLRMNLPRQAQDNSSKRFCSARISRDSQRALLVSMSVVSLAAKRPFAKTGSGHKQGTSNSVATTRGFSSSFFFSSCFSSCAGCCSGRRWRWAGCGWRWGSCGARRGRTSRRRSSCTVLSISLLPDS
eukprot:COSAG06_NODE_2256_length_7222_cov_14.605363_3_plen_231_part_00